MFYIFFLFLTYLNSFENKFTARGIFVTVEYKANEVRSSVRYSFRFLKLTDLFQIYEIPFYLIDDIKNFKPETSFKLKIYGQNFYIFKYIKFNVEEEKVSKKDKTMASYEDEPDFIESYFKAFRGDMRFYIFDITFRGLIDDYSKLSITQRKAFISELDLVFRNRLIEKN